MEGSVSGLIVALRPRSRGHSRACGRQRQSSDKIDIVRIKKP
jgi:hypothetical protein